MKTLGQLFPPYLLALILFVQAVSLLINYNLYDSRELAIYACWIPVLTLPFFFTRNKVLFNIVLTVFFVDGLINLFHLLILKGPVTVSSLFVLSNTNMDEAREFMELKFDFSLLLLIPYLLLYIIAIKKTEADTAQPKSYIIIGAALLFSTFFIAENLMNGRLIRKGIPQTARTLASFKQELSVYQSLKKRKTANIPAKFSSAESKEHVFVLILGESCNRNHLSLYNYSRKTNPRLENRQDIIVYRNVVSPYSYTMNSVLSILTEANLENKAAFDTSISCIDVFHSLGAKTYWLSNQSPIGVWDNAIYNIAQTADVAVFVNNGANSSYESTYKMSYDEKLFQPLHTALNETGKDKFIILHLMGNHTSYGKRYPPEYNRFKDYTSVKEEDINHYDNSVLYNDFVVDSMFSILNAYSLKNKEAICSAIYLSDHGENVYDDSENVGHNYSGKLPKSIVEIPFIVWLSQGYKSAYSDKVQTIEANKNLPFVSDDLFHTILDMNVVECSEYIPTRSVVNSNFNASRPRVLEDKLDYDLQ
jgi:heptose-I-phosphate ethanolaminephosphotransferase